MKPLNVLRTVLLGTLLGMATLAQAEVRPNDIANAVQAHNLPQAESLAQEATRDHPRSAKAWYMLAEVEERLHKPTEGLTALRQAQQIDPSGHYAKDPAFIDQLQTQLNRQQASMGQGRSGTTLSAQGPVAMAPAAVATTPSGSAQHGHFPWGIVLLVLVVIGAGIAAIVVMGRKKTAAEQEGQRQDAQRLMGDAQTRAMALQQTIRFEGKTTSQLNNDVTDILNAINTEITHLKSTSGNAWLGRDQNRDQAIRALNDAERRQRSGAYDSIAPAARTATERIADADAAAQARADQQRRDDQIRAQQASNNGGYNPGYPGGGYQPQPVIIDRGSNPDGLLTGVLLGEALSDHRERVVERDVYIDRGRDNSWDDDNTRRAAPDPAPSDDGLFDTGSGGNSWNDSSNDTSSNDVDSGSDNSFDS